MQTKLFSELGLSSDLLRAIDKLGFEQAAPIQAAAIPILMQGTDVVGQSQTGSGKTAAFAIPAIEKTDVSVKQPQVLVLCPTRELAVQVSEEIHKLAYFKRGLHALPIYGGQSYDRQFFGLRQGAHIVIGTPGRIMDHMRRATLRLDALKMVVLDEVDVMLNMGFREDIELILQACPAERQTVFFSATIPYPIRQLIEKFSRNPQHVQIEQKVKTVPTVEQIYYEVDRHSKVDLLTRLIDLHDFKLGIVFCNTKRMVDDLVDHLNAQGYSADRLHGDMSQAMRDRVMNKFRKSGLEFLVATDVAARGIDVDDVQVVFNYDLPYDGEDYVHRIGRTGRQGRSGVAISFASGREIFQIRVIERYTNTRVQRGRYPTLQEVEAARENVFLDRVREALKAGEHKVEERLVERLMEEGFSSTDIAATLLHLLQAGSASTARPPQREEFDMWPPRGGRREREDFPERRAKPERPRPVRARPEPQSLPGPAAALPEPQESAPVIPPPVLADRPTADTIVKPKPAKPPLGAPQARAQRKTPPTPKGQTRLFINAGAEMGVGVEDVISAIQGHTGLPRAAVGHVDVRERHVFVDVADEYANAIVAKLNRAEVKGRKLKVKLA
jgi:ATP-dependent RNA helicase DeaD